MTLHQEPATTFPFPFDGTHLPPEFAVLREREPVARIELPTGARAWLLTRYADVRTMLSDPRFSRAAAEGPGAAKLGPFTPSAQSLLGMDPPDHTRLRRLVSRAFTSQRMEQLRGPVTQRAEKLLADLVQAGPPANLLRDYALPLATTAIFELLGIPDADSGPLHTWTPVLFNATATEGADPFGQLERYLKDIIDDVRAAGVRDGVIGALINAHDDEGQLTEDELIHFVLLLVTAGHRSTANAIVSVLMNLLRRPELFDRLRDEPARIPDAVEELLRYNTYASLGVLPRVAVADVELGGVTIRAGDTVLASLGSADHDERVFPDGATVDIDRDNSGHLMFGYGTHFCIGAMMGRLEVQVAVEQVGRLLPRTLRLTVPAEEVPLQELVVGLVLGELPVTW